MMEPPSWDTSSIVEPPVAVQESNTHVGAVVINVPHLEPQADEKRDVDDSVRLSAPSTGESKEAVPKTVSKSGKFDRILTIQSWQVGSIPLSHLAQSKVTDKAELSQHVKPVRRFYKHQNDVIDEMIAWREKFGEGEASPGSSALQTRIRTIIYGSFATNACLAVVNLVAAGMTGSLAVIASTVDCFLDILSATIIFVAAALAKKRDIRKYPQGKTRFEPIAIVIFASVMGMAALQLILSSVTDIMTRLRTHDTTPIPMDAATWGILGTVVSSKLLLHLVCRVLRKQSPSVAALAQEYFNDFVSTASSIAAVGLSSKFPSMWWIDPAFAIAFSIFIICVWLNTGREYIQKLAGISADHDFLNKLTLLVYNYHSKILKIDTVRAYYFGSRLLVEVDIVLPEDITLKEAHDIGESLQNQIERLENVERAFVHLDYEWTHAPEHKVIVGV